jgi:predicted nucleic acid-binding protein
LLALSDLDDPYHPRAVREFEHLTQSGQVLWLHNYIVVETIALLQNRIGMKAVRDFLQSLPRFEMEWVSPELHHEAQEELARRESRGVSFVDIVSFLSMRRRDAVSAFTFDSDFANEGFQMYGVSRE